MPESATITDDQRRRSQPETQAPASVARMLPQTMLENLPKGNIANQPLPPQVVHTPQDTAVSLEEMIRNAERPASQTAATAQTPSLSLQRQKTSVVPPTPLQSSAVPAAEIIPESTAPTNELDQDWARLQTIMRKHQEAAAGEDTEDQSEPPTTTGIPPNRSTSRSVSNAVQREVLTREDQTTSNPPGTPPQKAQIIEFEPQSQPEASRQSPPTLPPSDHQHPEEIRPTTHPETAPIQTEAVSEESLQQQPQNEESAPPEELIEASQQSTLVSSSAPILPSGEPEQDKGGTGTEQPGIQARPEAKTAAQPLITRDGSKTIESRSPAKPESSMTPSTGLEALEEGDSPENEQMYPLESAWPVQRKTQLPQVSTPGTKAQHAASDHSSSTPAPDAQEFQQMQEVLGTIAIGQPTDSHVEVITPRKPRPVLSMSTPRVQPITEQNEKDPVTEPVMPEDSFSETPVQTKSTQPFTNKMDQPRTEFSQSEPSLYGQMAENPQEPGEQVVQRAAERLDVSAPKMVDTEIGPLPADLWHLVGATPPEDKINPTDAPTAGVSETTSPQPVQSSSKGKPLPRVNTSTVMEKPTDGQNGAALIQRTAETSTRATADTTSQAPSPGEEESQETGESEQQVNTDELARKVYSYIKRKLMVEWERLRKRT